MKASLFLLFLIYVFSGMPSKAQFLSHLNATKSDALFTTYAAPPGRSEYKSDQGYQFQWTDEESGIGFISSNGPNMGLAFLIDNRLIYNLGEHATEPTVVTSYSDLVKFRYSPVPGLRVDATFVVYSSTLAILQYNLSNTGDFPKSVTLLPYLWFPSDDTLEDLGHRSYPEGYSFKISKKRDGWMKEHQIPLIEDYNGLWMETGSSPLQVTSFIRRTGISGNGADHGKISSLINSISKQGNGVKVIKGMIRQREFRLAPGDVTSLTLLLSLKPVNPDKSGNPLTESHMDLMTSPVSNKINIPDFDRLVKEDEKAYSKIPGIESTDRDKQLLYWSAFSLMRQCMMPPEGSCKQNYYVFSREPKWGWGYGGQVFHESLTMLAYVFMDPQGAMNSQRVFMERQQPDGYINYRTGPYLDETIETDGKPTSSAPWFNFVNYEIFKVTQDQKFLKDAYASGKKFYHYYVLNRDSDHDGLCEWGAHAELESVRDARVAVWDKVGWPANFEGPDVNSMLVMEAKSLSEMAISLGLREEAAEWISEAEQRKTLINRYLWDPATSFYYNVNKRDKTFSFHSDNDLKIREIIGFLPLWAGVADSLKAVKLVETMLDTAEFWRPFGVPSLSASSDYYCPIGYWNGPVWVQWDYLLYRGLRDYKYNTAASDLAGRVLDNMTWHLKKDHVFWEFYSPDDRQAGWNKTYIWAGIAARFLLDEANRETKTDRPVK